MLLALLLCMRCPSSCGGHFRAATLLANRVVGNYLQSADKERGRCLAEREVGEVEQVPRPFWQASGTPEQLLAVHSRLPFTLSAFRGSVYL